MLRSDFDTLFASLREQFNTPVQCGGEFYALVELVSSLNPRHLLEIGVERGGTLPFWQKVVSEDGLIVGVDTQVSKVAVDLLPKPQVILLEGDSHNNELILKASSALPEVDFLFIDGDHTYEGVKADFVNFSSLVRFGGVVAFHDIHDTGVSRFWGELENTYRTKKFHEQDGGIGIGVLYL